MQVLTRNYSAHTIYQSYIGFCSTKAHRAAILTPRKIRYVGFSLTLHIFDMLLGCKFLSHDLSVQKKMP